MSESVNETDSMMDLGPMEQAYESHALLGNVNIECYERLKPLLHQAINEPAECSELLLLMLKLVNGASNLSETILADSVRVFDIEDSMKVSLDEEAMNNANMLIGPLAEPLSQRERVMSNVRLADLSASSASSDSIYDATASKSHSSSGYVVSHANNDWQSGCESSDLNNPKSQQGKKRKREQTSSSTAAVVPSFVPFDMESATVEIDSLAAQFDTLNSGQSDTYTPIALEASIVDICQAQVTNTFLSGELGNGIIDRMLDDYLQLMGCKDMCRKEFILTEKKKVKTLESVPSVSESRTRGELLTSLSRKGGVDYNNVLQEAQRASASARAIESFHGKLTQTLLTANALLNQSDKNMLNILGNLSVGLEVLELFKVDEVFSPHDNHRSLIAELTGNNTSSVTALQLLELACLKLKEDEYESRGDKIRGLVLPTKEQVLRSDQAKEKFNAVASEGIVGVASTYFSTSPERRNALDLAITLLLADDIEARGPPGLFDEYGGFMLFVLDLSWRDITKFCRHFVDADFFAPHTPKAKSGRKMLESLAEKKKKKREKTKLIIYSKQQMNSLQALCSLKRGEEDEAL